MEHLLKFSAPHHILLHLEIYIVLTGVHTYITKWMNCIFFRKEFFLIFYFQLMQFNMPCYNCGNGVSLKVVCFNHPDSSSCYYFHSWLSHSLVPYLDFVCMKHCTNNWYNKIKSKCLENLQGIFIYYTFRIIRFYLFFLSWYLLCFGFVLCFSQF